MEETTGVVEPASAQTDEEKTGGLVDRLFEAALGAVGATIGNEGPDDLVIVIESIHDLPGPVQVLEGIRQSLAPEGTLIVADENVSESFTAPGNEVDRLMYGFSFLVCLPSGLSEQPSAATGTVMRPDTFRRYAKEAGFSEVEILDQVKHDFLRFYRLTP